MAETQALGAMGLNCCGSVSADGLTSPVVGSQNNFNVASVTPGSAGRYAILPSNPIPRTMGQINVEIFGVAGLSWRLITWNATTGLITIEIDLAGVATAAAFDFMVWQTNLDSN